MDEHEVGMRVISYHYEDIEMIKWIIEFYKLDEGTNLTDKHCPFEGRHIGNAELYFYDASRKNPYNLRMDANTHTQYSQFEILNSVRIFQDEFDYEMWREDEDQSLDEGELDYADFSIEELESIKSWTEYDENTLNIYGKLVCLNEIKIFTEHRNQGFGRLAIEQIIQYFGRIGMDFLLLKPYPIEGDFIEDKTYRLEQVNRLINFYQMNEFELTKGKLLNDFCMVKRINNL